MTQAGGGLRSDLIRSFYERTAHARCRFFVMYGQTEATARIAYVPYERLGEKFGSIGIPIPGGHLSLGRREDSDAQELIYQGPNVMMGYADSANDLAVGDQQHGTLRTGDLATADSEGFFYLTGRLKRFAKLFGHRISLDDIEKDLEERYPIQVAATDRNGRLLIYASAREKVDLRGLESTWHRTECPFAVHRRRCHRGNSIDPQRQERLQGSTCMSGGAILEKLFAVAPYSIRQEEKRSILTEHTRNLTRHHYERCELYRKIVDRIFGGPQALEFDCLENAPFLPVSLFKTRELRSVASDEVIKTLTSSGTTGQAVSRICLDAFTAQLQSRVMVRLLQHFLGVARRPLVFLDHKAVVRDRKSSSARAAGILGILPFGREPFYALREDMSLDLDGLDQYVERTRGQNPVFFGFTFMIWQYFVEGLEALGRRLSLPGALLLHSGGWKKLEAMKVSQEEFRRRVQSVSGIETVINYYGMVEQVGSVYFENSLHFMQPSVFSEIVIRDQNTLEPVPPGQRGNHPGSERITRKLSRPFPAYRRSRDRGGV